MATEEKSLNFLEQIIEEDLKNGLSQNKLRFRFPPEPNGYLHVGHDSAICLNFGLGIDYQAPVNLRFDDTNPAKEEQEYVDAIKKDIEWLGYQWANECYASDYFQQLYDWAVEFIKKGKAYVDSQTSEEMAKQKGTPTQVGTNSPYRDRSVEENLDLFERMKNGEFEEGTHILRAKIDMASPNMLMRDPIMYRILKKHHHRTGNDWCIYPMYDWAHGESDYLEQISHSFCTLEFLPHRELYDWFLDQVYDETKVRPKQREFMADFEIQKRGISPVDNPTEYEAEWPAEIAKQKAAVAQGHEEVVSLGGLYVLGTERHESRRIDNQLRGRSGRQGDPGESRFYLSLQDDLMRRFNSTMVERFLTAAGIPEDQPIESKMVSNSIKSAQTQVEAQNFEIRKNVLKYDDVMNRQREVIYGERRSVLEGKDISEQVKRFLAETITAYVSAATADGYAEDWDLDTLFAAIGAIYPMSFTLADLEAEVGGRSGLDTEFLASRIIEDAHAAYAKREETLTPPVMRELERKVLLSVLDRKWREHLYEMDYLQEGIGLLS